MSLKPCVSRVLITALLPRLALPVHARAQTAAQAAQVEQTAANGMPPHDSNYVAEPM